MFLSSCTTIEVGREVVKVEAVVKDKVEENITKKEPEIIEDKTIVEEQQIITEEKEEEKEENVTSHNLLTYAKMENNYHLSNKKAVYYNMKVYCEAIGKEYHHHLPLTFHIKEGLNDPAFLKFEQLFHDA